MIEFPVQALDKLLRFYKPSRLHEYIARANQQYKDWQDAKDAVKKAGGRDKADPNLVNKMDRLEGLHKSTLSDMHTTFDKRSRIASVIDPFAGNGLALRNAAITLGLMPYSVEPDQDLHEECLKAMRGIDKMPFRIPFQKTHHQNTVLESMRIGFDGIGLWLVHPPYGNLEYMEYCLLNVAANMYPSYSGNASEILLLLPSYAVMDSEIQKFLDLNFQNRSFFMIDSDEDPYIFASEYQHYAMIAHRYDNSNGSMRNIIRDIDQAQWLSSAELKPRIIPEMAPPTFLTINRAADVAVEIKESKGGAILDATEVITYNDKQKFDTLMPLRDGHAALVYSSGIMNNITDLVDTSNNHRIVLNGQAERYTEIDPPTINPDGTITLIRREQTMLALYMWDKDYEGDDPYEAFRILKNDAENKDLYHETIVRFVPQILKTVSANFTSMWSPDKSEDIRQWLMQWMRGPQMYLTNFTRVFDNDGQEYLVVRYDPFEHNAMVHVVPIEKVIIENNVIQIQKIDRKNIIAIPPHDLPDSSIKQFFVDEQLEIVESLAWLHRQGTNIPINGRWGAESAEMGTGKTFMSLCVTHGAHKEEVDAAFASVLYNIPNKKRFVTVVIAPPHLVRYKWEEEAHNVLHRLNPNVITIGKNKYQIGKYFSNKEVWFIPFARPKFNKYAVSEFPTEKGKRVVCHHCRLNDVTVVMGHGQPFKAFTSLEEYAEAAQKETADIDTVCPECGNIIIETLPAGNYVIDVVRTEDNWIPLGDWYEYEGSPIYVPFELEEFEAGIEGRPSKHNMKYRVNRGAASAETLKKFGLKQITRSDLYKMGYTVEEVKAFPYVDPGVQQGQLDLEDGTINGRWWTGGCKFQYPDPELGLDESVLERVKVQYEFWHIKRSIFKAERDLSVDEHGILNMQVAPLAFKDDQNKVVFETDDQAIGEDMDYILNLRGYQRHGFGLTPDGKKICDEPCIVHYVSLRTMPGEEFELVEQEYEIVEEPGYPPVKRRRMVHRRKSQTVVLTVSYVPLLQFIQSESVVTNETRTMPIREVQRGMKLPGVTVMIMSNITMANATGWVPSAYFGTRLMKWTERGNFSRYNRGEEKEVRKIMRVAIDPESGTIFKDKDDKPIDPDRWMDSKLNSRASTKYTLLCMPRLAGVNESGEANLWEPVLKGAKVKPQSRIYNHPVLGVVYDTWLNDEGIREFEVLHYQQVETSDGSEFPLKFQRQSEMPADSENYQPGTVGEDGYYIFKNEEPCYAYQSFIEVDRVSIAHRFKAYKDNSDPYVSTRRYPVGSYLAENHKYEFAMIADEGHILASRDSAQGRVFSQIVHRCTSGELLTGTIINGFASSIYYLLWRMHPEIMKKAGFTFNDEDNFVEKYGFRKFTNNFQSAAEYSRASNNGFTSGGKTDTSQAPGVQPGIITLMTSWTGFLSMEDLGVYLPDAKSEVAVIDMDPMVEEENTNLFIGLREWIRNNKGRGVPRLWGSWLHSNMRYSDALEEEVFPTVLEKDSRGNVISYESEVWARHIDYDVFDGGPSKMKYVLKRLQDDWQLGLENYGSPHFPILFIGYVNATPTEERWAQRMCELNTQWRPIILKPNYVEIWIPEFKDGVVVIDKKRFGADTTTRLEMIAMANRELGGNALICSPDLVSTGADLIKFSRIHWIGIPTYKLTVAAQAQARIRRLGQSKDLAMIFWVYRNSIQVPAAEHMAVKMRGLYTMTGQLSADTWASFGRASLSLEENLIKWGKESIGESVDNIQAELFDLTTATEK